jgi:NAD+ kinase
VEFYLRERDWGVFDNMAEDERLVKYPDWKKKRKQDGFFWAPPNGESVADVCLRNERILNTLHRECSDKRVVIVLHGETMWAFRVRLERMSQKRYHELDESKDPKDQIYNCQILHYTRRNPGTNELAPYLNWFRSICPSDLRLSRNSWETIVRPKYSNEDLLAEVEKTPRLID